MPLARDINRDIVQALRPATNQQVSVSSASAATATAFTKTVVRVCSTTDCRVAIGADPTALATSLLLPAGVVEYFAVSPGDKLAAIRESADGLLTVTEMD